MNGVEFQLIEHCKAWYESEWPNCTCCYVNLVDTKWCSHKIIKCYIIVNKKKKGYLYIFLITTSLTPPWVHWLQTEWIWWRAGQVLILLQLLLQSIRCRLNAYDEEQGAKYRSFSNSFFSLLTANSIQMMKSRGPSTDPSPTQSSVH